MEKIEITQEEWNKYRWYDLGGGACIRGVKRTEPPEDGFHYIETTTYSDTEQKWERAYYIKV